MPRTYINKGLVTQVDCENVAEAVRLVKFGNCSARAAAATYLLNYRTLNRYIRKVEEEFPQLEKVTDSELLSFIQSQSIIGGKPLFTDVQEQALVQYILKWSKINYRLTINDILSLAFVYAKKCGVRYSPSWNKQKRANKDWYYGFVSRHHVLSLCKLEPVMGVRTKGFCKKFVNQFFANYKAEMDVTKFSPHRIWSIAEINCPTVPTQNQNLTQQNGTNIVTMAIGISVTGRFIPPFFFFSRKVMRATDNLPTKMPSGSVGLANESGSMAPDFIVFMRHFIKHTSASKDNPLLLFMDNDKSYIKLEVIDLFTQHGITIVTIPPKCSHKMQPLEVSVFGPFKSAYTRKYLEWRQSSSSRVMTIQQVVSIAEIAMIESFTTKNICAGFQKTGIFPINVEVFSNDSSLIPEKNTVLQKTDIETAEPAEATVSLFMPEIVLIEEQRDMFEQEGVKREITLPWSNYLTQKKHYQQPDFVPGIVSKKK